jgi:hypothetical protein
MTKVYVVMGAKIRTHKLIKETEKSFIIERKGAIDGRVEQPRLMRFIKYHGGLIDKISTTDLECAKAHAKAEHKRLVDASNNRINALDSELDEALKLTE